MPHPSSRLAAVTAVVATLILSIVSAAAAAGGPGTISFTSLTYEVGEAAGNASITLTRTGGTDGTVIAKVSPAGGTAVAADYRLQPGEIDPTFTRPSSISVISDDALAVQPDGKILIGQTGTVRRMTTTGALDPTFTPPTLNGKVISVAVQPDGKILICGYWTVANNEARGHVLRLNADGTIDPAFNAAPGLTFDDSPLVVAGAPGGKVFIGGYFTKINGVTRNKLARLNADGTLDTSFDAVGRGGASNVYAMAVQPDGKVIACGFGTARYNTDGSTDNTFAGGGGITGSAILAVALQPDGRVVIGGQFTAINNVPRSHIAQLHPDGTLDTSFDPGSGVDQTPLSVAVQPDGKVLIGGGFTVYNGAVVKYLARLNTDGSLDTTFTSPLTAGEFVYSIRVQPDGKIVVAPFNPSTALRRLVGDIFVTWGDGDGADKTVLIPIVNDLIDEQDETLALNLTPVSGDATTGAISQTILTILDNDVPPQFTTGAPAVAVAGQFYTHTFQASGFPAPTFSVTGGTLPNGLILNTTTGVLSGSPFTPGTYPSITVTASNGVAPSVSQTFDMTVLSGGSLQFSANSYTVAENGGSVDVTVDRVGGSAGATSVNFVITGNTASSGSDFAPASTTLNFADGETSKTVTVTIVNDDVNERDEFANLFLNTVTGTGRLGTPTVASLNINNDDPLPSIAVEDMTVTEGDSGTKLASFTVTRTGLTDRAIGFTARTIDGTANSVEDFSPLNSFFQLPSSAASTTVTVAVYGDTIIEPEKSFSLLLTSPTNGTISRAQATGVIKDNDTTTGLPTVQFGAREFKASEGAGVVTVTVTRSGDSSSPTNIGYTTSPGSGNGIASERRDYNLAFGTLRFAAGETSKSFDIFVADDAFVEGDETLLVNLGTPTGGAALGTPSFTVVRILDNDTAPSQSNPLDDTTFFVRQHYRDFLNRDPDAEGLAFWVNEIESCGADAQCREVKRINVSAAFFLAIEFQETGGFVYLLHKAAFNSGERVTFRTFLGDMQTLGEGVVVGKEGWEARVEANRVAFINGFLLRSQFMSLYPETMTPAQYVDALNNNTGDPLNPGAGGSLTQAERDQLVAELTSGAKTRAQVLRAVVENREFKRRQTNKAFVLMQYFGYLRRGPNESPDTNFDGYNFWLGKLNDFQGNYINAEMVKAFISAPEYRQRFGQ